MTVGIVSEPWQHGKGTPARCAAVSITSKPVVSSKQLPGEALLATAAIRDPRVGESMCPSAASLQPIWTPPSEANC